MLPLPLRRRPRGALRRSTIIRQDKPRRQHLEQGVEHALVRRAGSEAVPVQGGRERVPEGRPHATRHGLDRELDRLLVGWRDDAEAGVDAGWHTAPGLAGPAGVRLVHLPPYSRPKGSGRCSTSRSPTSISRPSGTSTAPSPSAASRSRPPPTSTGKGSTSTGGRSPSARPDHPESV